MFTPTRGAAADALSSFPAAPGLTRKTLNDSTSSFAHQFANSLESYLSQASTGSRLEIAISAQNSPDSGTRQFVVTVKDASASGAPLAAGDPNKLDVTGMMMFSGIPSPPPAVSSSPAPITDEADAYWALQPKEVQVLRTIPDQEERWELGRKLAQQGFSIDTHIMLDFWDPYMTMKVRKEEGYTWVPALGQGTAMNRPGMNFAGLAPYDALNPPSGSIRVSTDFAIGLEHTSPGGRSADNSSGS